MADIHKEMEVVLCIKLYGQHDGKHQLQVASTIAQQMQRAFGMDKVRMWVGDRRIHYNPVAKFGHQVDFQDDLIDAENLELPELPLPDELPTNGDTPDAA